MHSGKCTLTIFITLLIIFSGSSSLAADWPMWRHDAARSAVTTEQLPAQLHLQWVHQLANPKPAWPDNQYKLQFDMSYEPVVSGGKMFVNSMVSDSLTAYDTKTGAEIWRFYADGPIRLAPVAYNSKVYFASDDGYLYCLNAGDGSVLWKFRGGPTDRKILGNDRLIGMWPGRAGLVLYDGKIYFAAGIWPFMGIFLYELDAETGKISWSNTGDGSLFTMQPHLSPAFGSVAPQGYLTVTEKHLFIANRSSPAVYDRKTGELVYFRHSNRDFDKRAKHGGCAITVFDKYFFNGGFFYDIKEGKGLLNMSSIYYRSIKSMVLVDDEAIVPDPKAAKKHWKASSRPLLEGLARELGQLPDWNAAAIESAFEAVRSAAGDIGMGKLAQPVRIAITGSAASPGIFETLAVLPQERAVARIELAKYMGLKT